MRTGTEPGDSPDTVYDERTFFQKSCRQPGTRINQIMCWIEAGWTDEQIATRLGKGTEERDISVYRKALNGTLCDLETGRAPQSARVSPVAQNYEMVGALYFGQHMTRASIAAGMGLKKKTVDSCIDKYRREYKVTRRAPFKGKEV